MNQPETTQQTTKTMIYSDRPPINFDSINQAVDTLQDNGRIYQDIDELREFIVYTTATLTDKIDDVRHVVELSEFNRNEYSYDPPTEKQLRADIKCVDPKEVEDLNKLLAWYVTLFKIVEKHNIVDNRVEV